MKFKMDRVLDRATLVTCSAGRVDEKGSSHRIPCCAAALCFTHERGRELSERYRARTACAVLRACAVDWRTLACSCTAVLEEAAKTCPLLATV